MDKSINSDLFPVYQSANNENVKQNFVVRKTEFNLIIDALSNKKRHDSVQHELILGRRGSGKSTLLKRIEIELAESNDLKKKYIAINLAEEQAGIYRLFDLWEHVLQEIHCKLNLNEPLKEYSEFDDEQYYTRYLFQCIHECCQKIHKRAVLLLDNFDRIVENLNDNGHLLREELINYSDIVLIAASTRMDEHFWEYDKPFYEFFRRHHLEALSSSEAKELLIHWSQSLGLPKIEEFVRNHTGKMENIRLLTDGLPRTMYFYMEIVLQNEKPLHVDFLKKIMDEATPQYQERLNYLTSPQRKIVLEMAFIWEACSTKQLSEKCKMESKLVSAFLKDLAGKGIVDVIPTGNRNNLYRISERFFNMWLIVTQGNPDQKRKARWLSIFLENWYDAKELEGLVQLHIDNLKNKKILPQESLLLTKGLSQSKYTSSLERDTMLELSDSIQHNQLIELPKKIAVIGDKIVKCVEAGNYKQAHKLAESIEIEKDGFKEFAFEYILGEEGNCSEAEHYYKLAIEKGHTKAMYNLGLLYTNQRNFSEAEHYYKLAIEKGHTKAMFNLGLMYYQNNTNKEQALLYMQKSGDKAFTLLFEIWNGIFNDVENRLIELLKDSTEDLSLFLVKGLLVHHQKSVVYNVFTHPEIGKQLQEQYTVLYYACLILNGYTENNLMLKIPPELESTVKDVLEDIKTHQKYYE